MLIAFFLDFLYCLRYYNLDAYYRRKMEKEMKKGPRKVLETERTIFNDEEQRRYASVFDRFLPAMNLFLIADHIFCKTFEV